MLRIVQSLVYSGHSNKGMRNECTHDFVHVYYLWAQCQKAETGIGMAYNLFGTNKRATYIIRTYMAAA